MIGGNSQLFLSETLAIVAMTNGILSDEDSHR